MGTNFISIHLCIFAEYSIFLGRVYTTAVCYLFNKFHICTTTFHFCSQKNFPHWIKFLCPPPQTVSKQIKVLFNILFLCFLLFLPLIEVCLEQSVPLAWGWACAPGLWQCDREVMPFSAETLHLPFCWLRGDFCVARLQVLKFSIKQQHISLHRNILIRVLEIGC